MDNDEIVLACIYTPWVWNFYPDRAAALSAKEEADASAMKLTQHGAPPRVFNVMTFGEYLIAERAFYLNEPLQEITKARFFEMLEILPPRGWVREGEMFERFSMLEHTQGVYTEQYARYSTRYFMRTVDYNDPSTYITAAECRTCSRRAA